MFFSMDLYISFVEHRNDVCIGCAFSFPFWSFMDVKRLCTPDGVIFFGAQWSRPPRGVLWDIS